MQEGAENRVADALHAAQDPGIAAAEPVSGVTDTEHSDPAASEPGSGAAAGDADTQVEGPVGALGEPPSPSFDPAAELQRQQVRAKLFGRSTPSHLGRYRIVDTLGEGGMGVVFTAVDEDLGRKIALKVLHASSGSSLQRRLQREARAMAKLNHPNVVTVHEVTIDDGRVCVAMEFVVGKTLRAFLEAKPSLQDICGVFAQTARGLIAAHDVGIIHRDLKPDNVLVGDDGRVRVLDFGLAKTLGELHDDDPDSDSDIGEQPTRDGSPEALDRLTITGAVMGTPRYMAPEQFRATECDARTDQFAFCIALYEAVYAQRPFVGETVHGIGAAVVAGDLQPPPAEHDVPAELAEAIHRGLQTDPEARFTSMAPLLELLAAGVNHQPVVIPAPRAAWWSRPSVGRRALLLVAVAAALAVAFAVGIFAKAPPQPQPTTRTGPRPTEALAPPGPPLDAEPAALLDEPPVPLEEPAADAAVPVVSDEPPPDIGELRTDTPSPEVSTSPTKAPRRRAKTSRRRAPAPSTKEQPEAPAPKPPLQETDLEAIGR